MNKYTTTMLYYHVLPEVQAPLGESSTTSTVNFFLTLPALVMQGQYWLGLVSVMRTPPNKSLVRVRSRLARHVET